MVARRDFEGVTSVARRIAVIGGGNGAYAAAAHLTYEGHTIAWYDFPDFREGLDAIRKQGTLKLLLDLRNSAAPQQVVDVPIPGIVDDLGEALRDAEIVLVIVPANAHERVARACAGLLSAEQLVCLMPGGVGGTLVFYRQLRASGHDGAVRLCETATLPYNTRRRGLDTVWVSHLKRLVLFASFPATHTAADVALVHDLFPALRAVQDVLETGLNNGNPIAHAPACILNAGWIETAAGEFYMYRDGVTPSVARVQERADLERQAVCAAFGYSRYPAAARMYDAGDGGDPVSLYRAYKSEVFKASKGPKDLSARYITEDVPYGLVPWIRLAEVAGVHVPILWSLAHLAGALNATDYVVEGRQLTDMGLRSASVLELRAFLKTGVWPEVRDEVV